ncbi:MAG: alpha/beta hydrolase [Polaromonas sp.]|nr:alpha/beta hydrolase [Polaromonas sp.]
MKGAIRPTPRIAGRWRWALAVALVLALVWSLGPRNDFGPNQPHPRAAPPTDLALLEAWLAQGEATQPHLRPDTAKRVRWHAAPGQRTPWAVVYVHGFTATRLETAPLAQRLASQLGANLFETRLSGHGADAQAMGEATVQDWLADTVEAVQVGQRLGERVLLLGVSTGATLGNWLALQPQGAAVAAQVWVSPNYGPAAKRSELINGPWGQQMAVALEGDMRGQLSDDPRENNAWTQRYPTQALFPMMALVKQVRESDLSAMRTPVLVLYSPADQTVDAQETVAAFARLGSPLKVLEPVTYSEAKGQHVLAGDIRAPNATARMAERMAQWVKALPAAQP